MWMELFADCGFRERVAAVPRSQRRPRRLSTMVTVAMWVRRLDVGVLEKERKLAPVAD